MGKKVIITGGSGLIGEKLCKGLTEDGWDVANFDTEKPDNKIHTVICDIGNEASVSQAFEMLGWDNLDLLINNAAYQNNFDTHLTKLRLEEWEKTVTTNLTGIFLMSRAAAKLMNKGGAIINLASTRAFMSEGGDFPYAATKGGIVALSQALAINLGPHIRVNAIAPGWITDAKALRKKDHEQHPAGRVGRPEDILGAVRYLADAEFVTGETLTIDGGMTKKMIYEH
ncbi:MAG: short-chain dehydrogenase [Alphaproteobacteria bacterium]|nr:short-chain dehydrogenase [Alphaproteobacteria bacterium]|tara:strand:+ start:74 stop:754 length:681 start_codon:yes stop_codon:yes gene_type:complete